MGRFVYSRSEDQLAKVSKDQLNRVGLELQILSPAMAPEPFGAFCRIGFAILSSKLPAKAMTTGGYIQGSLWYVPCDHKF